MKDIPAERLPDSTLALLRDPYRFVSRRAQAHEADLFRTRLLGKAAICMTGPEAARLFYTPGLFRRAGALPERIAGVLFGAGGIQMLDGPPHHARKAMFLDLMSDAELDRLDLMTEAAFDARIPAWRAAGEIDLFSEAALILTRAVCDWAGVPVPDDELETRRDQLSGMFLYAGAVGPKHRRGVHARAEAADWIGGLIERIRAAGDPAPAGSIAERFACWRGPDGARIPVQGAAADLLSLLRPTVANAVWIVHLAHAMHRHPEQARPLREDPAARHRFVQEVRRLYPFFPVTGAMTTQDIDWNGYELPEGTRVLLDLFGTSRDPRGWREPDRFHPDRFDGWPGDPFTMVPQGGGDHATGHRCPGEWISIRHMELFARLLSERLVYEVATPEADPDMRRPPALPRGGFRLRNVRAV